MGGACASAQTTPESVGGRSRYRYESAPFRATRRRVENAKQEAVAAQREVDQFGEALRAITLALAQAEEAKAERLAEDARAEKERIEALIDRATTRLMNALAVERVMTEELDIVFVAMVLADG
jgi:cellobiose-specific phosphotransferase system component IIA